MKAAAPPSLTGVGQGQRIQAAIGAQQAGQDANKARWSNYWTAATHQDRPVNPAEEGSGLASPWVWAPAGGAALGALTASDSGSWLSDRVRGATKGLLTGLGGAGGQALGGALTGGDLASRIAGAGLGAAGAYTLGETLAPGPRKETREDSDSEEDEA